MVIEYCMTLFWLDCWLIDKPLYTVYPTLFELCEVKWITVKKFLDLRGAISFRRWLPSILQGQWDEVNRKVLSFPFPMSLDKVTWKWSPKGVFTVKSTYDRLFTNSVGEPFNRIWKAKLPYKIKIFLWLIENGTLLTKDNMVKRNWQGDPTCRFCENIESIQHLFFECPLARVVLEYCSHLTGCQQYSHFFETILELVSGLDSHQPPNSCFRAGINLLGHLESQK